MKKFKRSRSFKAWNKKHRQLPTAIHLDPFLNVPVRINRNGRAIAYRSGRWQAV